MISFVFSSIHLVKSFSRCVGYKQRCNIRSFPAQCCLHGNCDVQLGTCIDSNWIYSQNEYVFWWWTIRLISVNQFGTTCHWLRHHLHSLWTNVAISFLSFCHICYQSNCNRCHSDVQHKLVQLSARISKEYHFDYCSFTRSGLFYGFQSDPLHIGSIFKSKQKIYASFS